MNKEELLQELVGKISTGEIKKEELLEMLSLGSRELPHETKFNMTKMLYVLGAITVIIGLAIFISQIWDVLGSFGHIVVTLGLGLVLTATGSILIRTKPESNLGLVFQSMGGLLIPGGSMVTLYELSPDINSALPIAVTFGLIFVFYCILDYVYKNAVLTFFAIASGTAFIYLTSFYLLGNEIFGSLYSDFYSYLTMVIGIAYLLLANSFKDNWNKQLVGVLSLFGGLAFFGASFYKVFESIPWQMFYFLITIGGLFVSAYMRSRIILIISTGFLIAHVSYITGKYFADSIGWPLSLVALGFIFIGLGYVSININKKYIKNS